MESDGSVTRWVADLRAGDAEAARALWERYFDRLVRLARRRLAVNRGADADEEDAALGAFATLCDALARGRFDQLHDRDDLWRLLVVITARKAGAQTDRRRALKRGGDRFRVDPGDRPETPPTGLDRFPDDGPTPEFAALVAEQYRRLLDRLGNDELRQIAVWRLEGYDVNEIAARLGCARRTIARRLDLIRQLWGEDEDRR